MANKKIRVIGKLPKNKNVFLTGGEITDLVGNEGTDWSASSGNGFDMSQDQRNPINNVSMDKAQANGSPVLNQGINSAQQNQGNNGFNNFISGIQQNLDPAKKMSNTLIGAANNIMDTISKGKSQVGTTTAMIQDQKDKMAESGKRTQALRLNTSRGLNDNPNINNGDNMPDLVGIGLGMIGKGIRDKRNRERLPLAQRIGLVTRSAYGGPRYFDAGGAISGASNVVNGVSMLTNNMVNQMQTTEDAQAIKEGIIGSQFGVQTGGDSFDLLAEDLNSYNDLNHLTKRDLRDRTVLEDIGNVLQATSEGAQYGFKAGNGFSAYGGRINKPRKTNQYLAGGIIGGIVGGAAGLITSAIGAGVGNSKAKNEAINLNKDIDYTNAFNNRMLDMRMENIMKNRLDNQLTSYSAFGGPTHGFSDFDNGIVYVNNGGTHEENPHGGVFMGTDEQGVPNMLEEGEVLYDNYVFSNRLMPGKSFKKKYKIKGKNSTFADAAKQISEEYEERPNDPISELTHKSLMSDLMGEHEKVRQKMSNNMYNAENQFGDGGKLYTKIWDDYSSGKISKEEYRKILATIPEEDRIYLHDNKKHERTHLPYLWKTDNNKDGRQYESTEENEKKRAEILNRHPEILKRISSIAKSYGISPKDITLALAREGFVDRLGNDDDFVKNIYSKNPKDSISGAMNAGLDFIADEIANGDVVTKRKIEVLPENSNVLANYRRKGIKGGAFRNLDDFIEVTAAKIKSIKDSLVKSYKNLSDEDLYYLTRAFYNRGAGYAAPDYENNNWNVKGTYNDYGAYDNLQYPEEHEPVQEEIVPAQQPQQSGLPFFNLNTPEGFDYMIENGVRRAIPKKRTANDEFRYQTSLGSAFPFRNVRQYTPPSPSVDAVSVPQEDSIIDYTKKIENEVNENEVDSNLNNESNTKQEVKKREDTTPISSIEHVIPGIYLNEGIKIKPKEKKIDWDKIIDNASGISADVFAGLNDLISRDPDYAKAIDRAASKTIPNIGFNPIGDYVPVKIFDRNYPANMLLAKNAATRRALGNNPAAILAADYNTGLEMGDLFRKADEANLQNLLQAENFNRGTNMFNSEGELKAAASNQNAALHNKSLGIQAASHAAAMRDRAYQQRELIKSNNYNNLKQNIFNSEKEKKEAAGLAMLGETMFKDDPYYNDYLSMLGIEPLAQRRERLINEQLAAEARKRERKTKRDVRKYNRTHKS